MTINQRKGIMKKLILGVVLFCSLLFMPASQAATKYVRVDGGTATQCNGLSDKAYTPIISDVTKDCAYNHYNWAIPEAGQPTTNRIAGGDTLIIGPGEYRAGCQGTADCIKPEFNYTNTSLCNKSWTYSCGGIKVPNGTASQFTKIYGCGPSGCGTNSQPHIYLTGRMDRLFDIGNTAYVEWSDLEITDHDGADAECTSGINTLCGRTAFAGNGWHDLLFTNNNIHGLTSRAFLIGGTGISSVNVNSAWRNNDISGNKSAGFDMDTCYNNGTCGVNGNMTFVKNRMEWNGCSEAYPVVIGTDGSRLPTLASCREGNNGGYGDMIGTSKTGGVWLLTDNLFRHNTSDAIDLLYFGPDYPAPQSVTVKRNIIEGNNGQAVKAASPTLEANKIIGNCSFWGTPLGKSYTAPGFSPCRATGSPISIQFKAPHQPQAKIYGNTIVNDGDVMVSYSSGGMGCNIDAQNNVMIGSYDYWGGDGTAMYYQEGCPSDTVTEDYNICFGVFKSQYTKCTNTHDKNNVDPQFTGTHYPGTSSGGTGNGYYSGLDYAKNFNLKTTSPAIGLGNKLIPNVDDVDINNFKRGTTWDLGAIEYDSVSGSVPPPVCVPDGTCTATIPNCGQTTTGVDNCGNTCSKTGPTCCVADGTCNAPTPTCGQTTTGTDNCGQPCTKQGTICCVSDPTQCNAPTPSCGQITTGVDNCGVTCGKYGPVCPTVTFVTISAFEKWLTTTSITQADTANVYKYIRIGYGSVSSPYKYYKITLEKYVQ